MRINELIRPGKKNIKVETASCGATSAGSVASIVGGGGGFFGGDPAASIYHNIKKNRKNRKSVKR